MPGPCSSEPHNEALSQAKLVMDPSAESSEGKVLNRRLGQLHKQLMEMVPDVDRVACVLYDPGDDLLKTFVNSTRSGEAISGYEYRLSDSASLSRLVQARATRVLDDIPTAVQGGSLHTLTDGHISSETVMRPPSAQLRGSGAVAADRSA